MSFILYSADVGQFVPKAIFTLDSEGHQSNVHPVPVHLLRRLRRESYSSSSSSSSSSSGNGYVVTSQSHQSHNADGTIVSGGSVQQVSTGWALNIQSEYSLFIRIYLFRVQPVIGQRFGDDSPSFPVGSYSSFMHIQDAQGHIQHYEDNRTLGNNGQWIPNQQYENKGTQGDNGQWKPDTTVSTTTSKY